MHSYEIVFTFTALLKPIVLPLRRNLTKFELDTRDALTALTSRRTLVRLAKSSEYELDPSLRTIIPIAAAFEIDLYFGDVCFRSVSEFLCLAREGVGCGAARVGKSSNRVRQHVGRSFYSSGIRIRMACALASGIGRPIRLVLPPGLVVRTPVQQRTVLSQGRTCSRIAGSQCAMQ